MQFLMGLNDSYAQIRAQILMVDPFPVIAKVFSIAVQEERQRSINSGFSRLVVEQSYISNTSTVVASTMASARNFLNAKSKSNKVVCSHCNYTNHTVDKC